MRHKSNNSAFPKQDKWILNINNAGTSAWQYNLPNFYPGFFRMAARALAKTL
jgi:hypothetical protein